MRVCVCVPLCPPQIFLNVTYGDGIISIYNGVINQDTNIFAGDYEDNTGFVFREVYKLSTAGKCTNYEVHGQQCEFGCNAGVSCAGHSCSCGAAKGTFEYLPTATASGNCGPANAGSKFTANVAATDDDSARSQTIDYCFIGDEPLSIHKKYTSAVSAADMPEDAFSAAVRRLAPQFDRISQITVKFNSWFPMQANPSAFIQPNGCQC